MLNVESYTIIAEWFPRLLGIIYFFTFTAFAIQIRGLIGENGILPAASFLKRIHAHYGTKSYFLAPTVFWCGSSNAALLGAAYAGSLFAILLLLGLAPPLMLVILYILYLSIVSVGQEFLSFGWEGFLLEVTVNAFLLSLTTVPNAIVWVSINFLLFRFHFMAGLVKLQSRDPSWRNQTATAYHYQTQPLPNTIAWYFYRLPLWFHKLSCASMFFVEMVVPFGIFLGEEVRLAAFAALAGLQFFIWLTGNLSFLNHLTLIFCTILLNNGSLMSLGFQAPVPAETPLWLDISLYILGGLLLALQVIRFVHHFIRTSTFSKILRAVEQFHIANRYGIFAVMTTRRIEIVIEGSGDGTEWKEYTFRYKPSEVTRRPRRVSPYQPRVDWQAWFLPFSDFQSERWFQQLLHHLLKGTPDVLKLLGHNPFPDEPPAYIRAIAYDYVFSTPEERQSRGWWWRRTYAGQYSPVLSLNKPR